MTNKKLKLTIITNYCIKSLRYTDSENAIIIYMFLIDVRR
jgi:hypothetical protein